MKNLLQEVFITFFLKIVTARGLTHLVIRVYFLKILGLNELDNINCLF